MHVVVSMSTQDRVSEVVEHPINNLGFTSTTHSDENKSDSDGSERMKVYGLTDSEDSDRKNPYGQKKLKLYIPTLSLCYLVSLYLA